MSDLFSADRLTSLTALREVLAAAIADCDSKRDLAALAGRFQAVHAEISALSQGVRGSAVDDRAAQRANRRANSTGLHLA